MERIEGDTNDSDSSSISNFNNSDSESSVSEGPLSSPTRNRTRPTYLKDYEVNLKTMLLTITGDALSVEQA